MWFLLTSFIYCFSIYNIRAADDGINNALNKYQLIYSVKNGDKTWYSPQIHTLTCQNQSYSITTDCHKVVKFYGTTIEVNNSCMALVNFGNGLLFYNNQWLEMQERILGFDSMQQKIFIQKSEERKHTLYTYDLATQQYEVMPFQSKRGIVILWPYQGGILGKFSTRYDDGDDNEMHNYLHICSQSNELNLDRNSICLKTIEPELDFDSFNYEFALLKKKYIKWFYQETVEKSKSFFDDQEKNGNFEKCKGQW